MDEGMSGQERNHLIRGNKGRQSGSSDNIKTVQDTFTSFPRHNVHIYVIVESHDCCNKSAKVKLLMDLMLMDCPATVEYCSSSSVHDQAR
jgi:hypothetical protein